MHKRWLGNNAAFFIAAGLVLLWKAISSSGRLEALLYDDGLFALLYALAMGNTLFDFISSFDFYFPPEPESGS